MQKTDFVKRTAYEMTNTFKTLESLRHGLRHRRRRTDCPCHRWVRW